LYEPGADALRLEIQSNDGLSDHRIKRFTGEDVYIGTVRVLAEMGNDVTGLNQLYKGEAGFVIIPEMDYLGIAVGFHIYLFDQGLAEVRDVLRTANTIRLAFANVQDQMPAPRSLHLS
jgi:hypothetical protein